MKCSMTGRVNVLSYLLSQGANINHQIKNGMSALVIAHESGHD